MNEPIFIVKDQEQLSKATGIISSFQHTLINAITTVDCCSFDKITVKINSQTDIVFPANPLHLHVEDAMLIFTYDDFILEVSMLETLTVDFV